MNDHDAIQAAYAAILDQLFKVLFDGITEAAGNAPAEAQALASFKAGLAIARKARDGAVASL